MRFVINDLAVQQQRQPLKAAFALTQLLLLQKCYYYTMLEKFGVHATFSTFLGSGSTDTSKLPTSTINSTDENFHQASETIPQEMALVLVLAQDCNVPVQPQTTARGT